MLLVGCSDRSSDLRRRSIRGFPYLAARSLDVASTYLEHFQTPLFNMSAADKPGPQGSPFQRLSASLSQPQSPQQAKKSKDKTAPFFSRLAKVCSDCQKDPVGVLPSKIHHIIADVTKSLQLVLQRLPNSANENILTNNKIEYDESRAVCGQICDLVHSSVLLVLVKRTWMATPPAKHQQRIQRGIALIHHVISPDGAWGQEQEFRTQVISNGELEIRHENFLTHQCQNLHQRFGERSPTTSRGWCLGLPPC